MSSTPRPGVDLDELDKLHAKATRGPLYIRFEFNIFGADERLVAGCGGHSSNRGDGGSSENMANAQLIKEVLNAYPALSAEIRDLREADAHARSLLRKADEEIAAIHRERMALRAVAEEAVSQLWSAYAGADPFNRGVRYAIRTLGLEPRP